MVQQQYPGYGQPPQPQYTQYPQYPPPAPGYGVPPGPPVGIPPVEVKWSGLETGGSFSLPVVAFIGRLTDMLEDTQSQYGLRIIEKFDQVQILESPVPWPWATIDPSIKYSNKENSGWGKHIASAKALGLAVGATTLREAKVELIGRIFEMRQVTETYGEDRQTGQTLQGDVWKFIRIVVPGQPQPFPQPPYVQPQPQPAPTARTPALAPVLTPAPAGFNATLLPTDTAPIRAKKLLSGRALNEWLGVALIDDKIKADPAFINTIYDQSFIVGLKASGQVTQGVDGKFQVVA